MLFKRCADIIIKGHRKTGRLCGLGAPGLKRRTASEDEEEERQSSKSILQPSALCGRNLRHVMKLERVSSTKDTPILKRGTIILQ